MAFFLKRTDNKKGTYLQIYESHYDHDRKETVQTSVKPIGYVHELIEQGVADPITYYREEIAKMNQAIKPKKKKSEQKITDNSPLKNVGYFLIKAVFKSLGVSKTLKILQLSINYRFDLCDLFSALIYSRFVNPCSKKKTFESVIPTLMEDLDVSYDDILNICEYLGENYERMVEIFTVAYDEKYGLKGDRTYFDCTNFYFEIDKEDDFRRKGPSKENRKDPIVGLGLLLDADQIPIGMKIYPGNQSEKPILRDVISGLKQKSNISGRTIQVADKGLNCSENIIEAIKNGDGYIFSKSVKQLPQTELDWIFNKNISWKMVFDGDGTLKYKYIECIDDYQYDLKLPDGSKKKITLKEKRVVTFNPNLAEKQRFEIRKLVEKAKEYTYYNAKKSECGESSKYINFKSTCEGIKTEDKVCADINEEAIARDMSLTGYNMMVTSELKMSANEIYSTYHNLWRIEESFRIMKSDLDARPVYLQEENKIKGHFLICYASVFLERILQIKVLKDQFGASELIEYIRSFNVVEISENKYLNITNPIKTAVALERILKRPLTNAYLNGTEMQKILNLKF